MRSIAARGNKESALPELLQRISIYLTTGPAWDRCELHVRCDGGEVIGNMTMQFDDDLATYGGRRDPWTQKEAGDYGMLDVTSTSTHRGKFHLVTLRGSAVVVRELNLYNILQYAAQSISLSPYGTWFLGLWREQRWRLGSIPWLQKNVGEAELLLPVPGYVAVTPWSYDEETWHDFLADTSNWMVYAAHRFVYKSTSLPIEKSSIHSILKNPEKYAPFAPPPARPVMLQQPILRSPIRLPHLRICRLKALIAY